METETGNVCSSPILVMFYTKFIVHESCWARTEIEAVR